MKKRPECPAGKYYNGQLKLVKVKNQSFKILFIEIFNWCYKKTLTSEKFKRLFCR